MYLTNLSQASVIRRGCIRALWGGLLCLALPIVAGAQSAKDSALYSQAQQMVANGDAAAGRRLADSVAAAAPAGSAAFAEGLYWRATLAANARDSEHAYRQIIVDYPLSGRVPDALLRIGQLESARGDNAAALQHFQRLVLEHPLSPLRAEASYWVAQMYFGANDATRACTANSDALANVQTSDVELKNRIDFQQQRCRGVALAQSSATVVPATAPVDREPPAESSKVATQTPEKKGVVSRSPTKEEVARALASAETPKISRAAKVASPKLKKGTRVVSTETAAGVGESKPGSGAYAVQVAAFGAKAPANSLMAKLRGRGYDAYIDGASAPYRVRIGHYATYAAATAELAKLKAKRIDGFVAER